MRMKKSRKQLLAMGLLTLSIGGAVQLASETLTLTTYYPSPAGIYRNLITTDNTILARERGGVGIGTANPAPSALLELSSTSRGLLLPRMNTAERDAITAPPQGLSIYNLTTHMLQFFNGTAWADAGGGFQGVIRFPSYVPGVIYLNDSGKNRVVMVSCGAQGNVTVFRASGMAAGDFNFRYLGIAPVPSGHSYRVSCNSGLFGWSELEF